MIFSRQIKNISGNLLIFTLLFLGILFCSAGKSLKSQNHSSTALSSIIIDAGHGGKDPGAVVGRACEKDIVLDIARRLGRMVRQGLPDVKVIYTRNGDYFVPLFKRSAIANKNNASLFISIHANFCESSSVKGTETYVLGLHRTQDNLEVAKKENSVILLEEDYSKRYEGFDPKSTESYIMFELIQDNHIEQSVLFAGMVQDRFRHHAGRSDRDVRQAGFLVLRETAMPSVLIETGYLSNKAEAAYLMSEEGRETIAAAIFNSIKSYKSKFDSRINFVSAKDTPVIKEKGKTISRQESLPTEKVSLANKSSKSDKKNRSAQASPDRKKMIENRFTKKEEQDKTLSRQDTSSTEEIGDVKSADQKPAAIKGKSSQLATNKNSGKNANQKGKIGKKQMESGKNSARAEVSSKTDPDQEAAEGGAHSSEKYSYAIQLAASKVKLSKTFYLFKGIPDIREVEIGGYFKYYSYESDSRKKTFENLATVKSRIPDAFAVGMKDGLPIPITQMPKVHP